LQTSRAIKISGHGVHDTDGSFDYIVEACDPCEANQYAYLIQGIAVSDFITPHFYDSVATAGTRYSFGGHITRPREVLPGGYISFVNTQSDELQQILRLGAKPQLRDLGPARGLSLRAFVDNQTHEIVGRSRKPNAELTQTSAMHRDLLHAAAVQKAKRYKLPRTGDRRRGKQAEGSAYDRRRSGDGVPTSPRSGKTAGRGK